MDEKIEILDNWYETISRYPKLKIRQAKSLYVEIMFTKDPNRKKMLNNQLIEGTLYIIYNFIKSSGLLLLNSSEYDINDIINDSCILLIEFINQGKLLDIKHYSEIFHKSFFNKLTKKNIPNYIKNYEFDNYYSKNFYELFDWYYSKLILGIDISYNSFLEFYQQNIDDSITDCYDIYQLFKDIFASMYSDDLFDDSFDYYKFSKTKLSNLKRLLIDNGIKYTYNNMDMNEISTDGNLNEILDSMLREDFNNYIFNSNIINDKEKMILYYYFGYDKGEKNTCRALAQKLGTDKDYITETYIKALKKIRNDICCVSNKQYNGINKRKQKVHYLESIANELL